MRQFAMILLLLGMLLAVGIVGAQEEEIVVSYYSFASGGTSQAFMENLQVQILEYDANISLVHHFAYEDTPENSLVDVFFFDIFDGEHIIVDTGITIWTDARELAAISPILESQLAIWTQISSEDASKYTIAIILHALGKNQEALDILNQLSLPEDEVDKARIEHLLGNIYIATADYEMAIEYLDNATRVLVQYNYRSLINLAWAYLANGETENAIEAITEFVEIDMGNGWQGTVYLLKKRAQIYALAFDYDSAIADMDEAIALAEENEVDSTTLAELYTIRGEIIFLIYEWNRVLENFNHAIEVDPNYAPAYFQRGVLYYTMSQRENALTDFEQYLELAPDGLYAEEAAQYIESIRIELESLGG